jgi:hypothetical protein
MSHVLGVASIVILSKVIINIIIESKPVITINVMIARMSISSHL